MEKKTGGMYAACINGTVSSELEKAADECGCDPDKYYILIRDLWNLSGEWWIKDENSIYLYLIDRVMDRAKDRLKPKDYHSLYVRVSGEYWMI